MVALPTVFIHKKRYFGLAVGRTSLRAVEIDNAGRVKIALEVKIPEDTFALDGTVKVENLVGALQKLLSVSKFSSKYVSVCFSEIYAFTRNVAVPLVPFSDVRETLTWRVKELFPFSEEDVYFDWKLHSQTEKELNISVIAVQKKMLDALTSAILTVGLKPLGFQPTAVAISALLKLKPEQSIVLVEINKRGSYVTLLEGEKNIFTTVVNYSTGDTPEAYLTSINHTITDILTYYYRKKIIKNIKVPIVFTGELASEGWAKKSGELLGAPVNLLKTAITNPAFNKAYAVAAYQVAPPDDETTINLLPPVIQSRYDREITESFYRTLFTRMCFLLILACVGAVGVFVSISLQRQQLDTRIKQLSSVINGQKSEKQHVLLLNAQAKNIVALAPLRKTVAVKLLVLNKLIPSTVSVQQWNYDDAKQRFTLKGVAENRSDLLLFKEKLESSSEFARITLPLGSLESPKNVQFTIMFDLKNEGNK